MSGRGRGRLRRDYPPRSEEKVYRGRNSAPPSRHLWVGNLPIDINERVLANHFLQFGEIEDIAFQPGRSYAFVNFKYDEEAFAAVSALQGFDIGGNQLKIEFAKADRSSLPHDEDFPRRRDEQRSEMRADPLLPRDVRMQHLSPDHQGKRKISDKDGEPSEVLWIGFPAQLRVDEGILRNAFSPFGEIERITVFQGRTYAFVRYKDIRSACIAKDTLQGRLFGNPRVHICFAKNESGSSKRDSPQFDPYGRSGFSEDFRNERKYKGVLGDPSMISPRSMPHHELDDPDMGFRRNGGFDQRRFQPGLESGPNFHDFPPHRFPRRGGMPNEDDWDLPEDNLLFCGNKKVKTTPFLPENELPEFHIPGFDQGKHAFPRKSPDFHHFDHGKNSEPGPFGYKQGPDHAMNPTPPYGKRRDHWGSSYDRFEAGPGSLPLNHLERSKSKPEQCLSEEWKWEGIIAKGGTPVCRARCFPKGKVLDMPLPEFLDCTARTGLDMLAKHYYQASSTWVVFFVPESDADIGFYNEFMHYLEEKQRAAVAKLDDRTTLFLVPPSEFSEKVLKIPGKLSISGVILRLENSGPNMVPPQNPHLEEPHVPHYQGDTSSYPKSRSPPRQYAPISSYPNMANSGVSDHTSHQRPNTFGMNSNFGKNRAPRDPNSSFDPPIQGYNPTSSSSGTLSALQPEQLAQLASSLLGQQKQSGVGASLSMGEDFRQSNVTSHSGTSYQQPQRHVYENNNSNQANSEFSSSQFGQARSEEAAQGGQSAISDEDQDPQKRLQATLQLAAALLQQIQQTKGN